MFTLCAATLCSNTESTISPPSGTKNLATGALCDAGERPHGAVHGEEPEAGPPLQVRGVRHQQGGRVPPHPDQGPRQGGESLQ
jgi:hypothetical protein